MYLNINIYTCLILLLLTGSTLSMQAQKTITGIVYDSENKDVLPGATITTDQSSSYGTITDIEGKFKLDITPTTKNIIISSVGYQTVEMDVTQKSELEIFLAPGVYFSEVVVTALGLERKSKSLGYAIQQLDGKSINQVKSPNFLDNLAGKVAGMTITSGSTGVGSSTKINIRGESSFTNTNPLFIVDGIPINNNTVVNNTNDDANGFMEVDFGNGAMDINPDDIASISVLKGPAAAALYGSRASNGAIVIKTKTGENTKGLGIQFNTGFTTDTPFRLPKFQNLYGLGNSGKYAYKDGLGGGVNDNITYSYGPAFSESLSIVQYDSPVTLANGQKVRAGDTALYKDLTPNATPFVAHPDNLKDFYQTGTTLTNHLSVTASGEKSSMRLSFTDLNSKSYIPGVNFERKTVAASLTFQPISNLHISSNLNYIHSKSDNRPATKYGSENINYALVAWFGRSNNISPLKDYWQPGLENVQQYSYNYTFFDNPYFTLYENRNAFGKDRALGNITARYDLTDAFSIQVRSGMDLQDESRNFRRAFSTNRFKNGAYAEQKVFFREINTDILLNYQKNYKDFGFDLSLGGNQMDQKASIDQLQTTILAQPGVYSLTNAAAPLEYYTRVANKKINSIYSLMKLIYKDFLFLDITGRNDWSSALATSTSVANTSFFYPSASLAMVLNSVTDLPDYISFAKVRASFAKVGNDTDPFQTNSAFVARTTVNGQPTFSQQNNIPNANLQPEEITTYELGVDLRFWQDRLRTDITYFNSVNKNQIISLPISNTTGYNQQSINGGAIRTKGWEIIAEVVPVIKNDFRWTSTFNFSTYRNVVESLPTEAKTITLAYNSIYDNVNQTVWYQVQEGGRLGDMWGTGYQRNENGDLIVGSNGQYIADNNLKKLGNYNPDFMLGWNNGFKYKNLSGSFLIDWRQGGIIVSRTLALAAVGGQLIETEYRPTEGIITKGVVNTGTAENPIWTENTKAIPAETYYRMYYDRNHEENNTYNGSYVKLREVMLGYTFQNGRIHKKLNELTISVIGRNLFAISHTPHFDPEQFGFQGQKLVSGVEDMSYPTTRSFGIKLGLSF